VAGLLAAAADSPACGHRLASLSLLWARAITNPPSGRRLARPADLPRLLSAARRTAPQVRLVEDCWQNDPRLVVRYRVGSHGLQVHPGAYSDPSHTLRIIASTAVAIDDFVLGRCGFSLSDLLKVGLRYSDHRLARLAPTWPSGALARDLPEPEDELVAQRVKRIARTPAFVTEEEVAVAGVSAPPEAWIAACAHPEQAGVAWRWATVSGAELSIDLHPSAQTLGRALAVDVGTAVHAVPAALIISALAATTAYLAAEAAEDEDSLRRVQAISERRAVSILRTPGRLDPERLDLDLPAVPSSPGVGLGMVLVPGHRHAFVVGTASGLSSSELGSSLEAVEAVLASVDIGALQDGGVPVADDAVVRRVVLYGGPFQEQGPSHPGELHVHVEELASMLLDANRAEIGADLVYQFLDEVASLPGVDELGWLDLSDVWRHWRRFGVINPTGTDGLAILVDPTPDEDAWVTSAAWEPIEAVLTAVGLPSVSDWYSARLDTPSQATLWTADRQACLVCSEPPLVVATQLDLEMAELGLDPAFAVGIADGILLTAARSPAVAAVLTTPDACPIYVAVRLTTVRPPGSDEESVGIGVATQNSPWPVMDLLLGPDWLELLAVDPRSAHRALGGALVYCAARLRGTDTEDARWSVIREAFLAAWEDAPPIAMLGFEQTTLTYRAKGHATLPRSAASRARASRALFREILRRSLPAGCWSGDEAVRLCKSEIIVAVESALTEKLACWSPDAVLAVAEHLNDAFAERARADAELERALAAPWAKTWQELALEAPESAEQTRPLELLLELLIANPPTGTLLPDRFDLAEATDLAGLAIETALALSGAERDLNGLVTVVGEGGYVSVVSGPNTGAEATVAPRREARLRFEVPAYLAADREHRFRTRPEAEEGPADDNHVHLDADRPRISEPFHPLSDLSNVPRSLLGADGALRASWGTGIDGFNAVLGTAVTWGHGDDRVATVPRDELRDAAVSWSSLPLTEIEAALNRLVLDGESLRTEGVRYWEQEHRRHRLAIQPLPLFGNRLILMPWRIFATQGTFAGYMQDGRLPWHAGSLPKSVNNAFNRYRQIANRELEREAAAVAQSLGLPHQANIEPHIAAAAGLQLPGELDLLVADPVHGRLWVCEVKDVYAAVSQRTLRARIDKFRNPRDGHVGQLTRLAQAVSANTDAAANLLSAPSPGQGWKVLPLMVTRRVEPAAFVDGVAVSFTVLDDLARLLQADDDPGGGHVPIGQSAPGAR
jgi:hypothetical protein